MMSIQELKNAYRYKDTKEDRNFFTEPAEKLAEWLLGKIICRSISETEVWQFRITETEAYPFNDTACHANKYKTGNAKIAQNMIGGTLYVHYDNKNYAGSSFDIVANKENVGEGVLIRGCTNINKPSEKYNQIRKLGEALKIDYKSLNRKDLLNSDQIWLIDDGFVFNNKIERKERIGLESSTDISDEDKKKPLRFILDSSDR